jgi:hypothetical protein
MDKNFNTGSTAQRYHVDVSKTPRATKEKNNGERRKQRMRKDQQNAQRDHAAHLQSPSTAASAAAAGRTA